MTSARRISFMLLVIIGGTIAAKKKTKCDVDPRKGMFVATAVGRAVHRFFNICWKYIAQLHRKPPAKDFVSLINFACENMDVCLDKFGETDMPQLGDCVFDYALANWDMAKEYDEHDNNLTLDTFRCMYPVVPSFEVLRHFILYSRKILG